MKLYYLIDVHCLFMSWDHVLLSLLSGCWDMFLRKPFEQLELNEKEIESLKNAFLRQNNENKIQNDEGEIT